MQEEGSPWDSLKRDLRKTVEGKERSLINGLTEEEAAERLRMSKSNLKKLRLAGMVNKEKYTYFQGYLYSENISRDDLDGNHYTPRGK